MPKKTKQLASWTRTTTVRAARVHYVFILAYILSTVAFDTWNLYTHEAVRQLWTAAGVLFVVNTVVWFVARSSKFKSETVYLSALQVLVLADIAFAAYNVHWQEGLASKSVALFALPIVTAAMLRSRSMLIATAALSAAAYSVTAVRYFFEHYGEGYRIELYGTVGFYCAFFFVLALLLMVVINPTREKM